MTSVIDHVFVWTALRSCTKTAKYRIMQTTPYDSPGNFLMPKILGVIHEDAKCRYGVSYKKLSYRRGTARCVVSVEILPIATQQCRNYLYDVLNKSTLEVGGLRWADV